MIRILPEIPDVRSVPHYDRAIDTFEKAVEKIPTDLLLWNGLAEVYKAKGDQDPSIEMLEMAVENFLPSHGSGIGSLTHTE
jgi:tetratricopeptide (TPR) repeat protein